MDTVAFDTVFRQLSLRPSLFVHGERQEGPLKVALGQQVWICLTIEPPEGWSRSVEDFQKGFEQHSSNIGVAWSCISGSKILVRQEAPFVFDFFRESQGAREDDAPRVRRTESGVEFRMGVQLRIGSQYHNKPLKLLLALSYNVEIVGLSSNALQMEAARRSSTLDTDRNDHLRGYVGMDEEELGVRQLMEFNRFRATKVPPREAELTVSIVKPLRLSSYCCEESPSSTILTVLVENVYPKRDISVHGVVLHSKDSIKGATLLEPPHGASYFSFPSDGMATSHDSTPPVPGGSSPRGGPPMPPLSGDNDLATSVRNDLLHTVASEDDKAGGDMEVVDLDDAAVAAESSGSRNSGGTRPASQDTQGSQSEAVEIPLDLESEHKQDYHYSGYEEEGEGLEGMEPGAARLSSESAYVMQLHGTALDASTLFKFTALDSLFTIQQGDTGSALTIPSGHTHKLRYRVEPRMADSEGNLPYLYSSLLLGDFFSPVSVMWSEVDAATTTPTQITGGDSALPHRVEPHVAYWSVGKRWANACAFGGSNNKDNDTRTNNRGASGTTTTPGGMVTPQKRCTNTPRTTPGMGTAVGAGTPVRLLRNPRSETPVATSMSEGSGTTTVITPSKRAATSHSQTQTQSKSSAGQEEGGFTLSVTGPECVKVGTAFDLQVEIRNRGEKACSGVSLSVGSAEGQEGYVVYEARTTFPNLLWPEHSVSSVLHVYPLRAGVLNFTSIQVKDGGDINGGDISGDKGEEGNERAYDFLQFYSCLSVED